MKYLLLTVALFLSPLFLLAQQYTAEGKVADGSTHTELSGATVVVLNAKDSIIIGHAYATENGSFKLSNLSPGSFILLITYPDYADYVETFTLDSIRKTRDFGSLNMRLKAKLLEEVKIKGSPIAVRMRRDTIEYNAAAYVIQPNSKVEDLLKQLPDIQVDRNGKITAQGTVVTKVLVDGEEFFGDDPLLVTQNIRGDMVNKVLLYDKKSDQAAFTGIDDGKRTKTIDIILKEDRKNGTFGKLIGGVATDKYYEGQFMYNRFKEKKKISLYTTTANNGKLGLGLLDNSKIGTSGSDMSISDQGYTSITNADDLESSLGRFSGNGFPVATTAGAHYDNKSADDSKIINTNYKMVSLDVTQNQTQLSQLTLPTNIINTALTQNSNSSYFRHKIDAAYQVKFNTNSALKIVFDAALRNSDYRSDKTSSNTDINNVLLNRNTTSLSNKQEQRIFNASLLYTKRFAKPGRTFTWFLSEAYNNSNQTGYQHSKTTLYNTAVAKDTVIDQYKPVNTLSSVFTSNITFSEQLSKTFAVVFNYAFNANNSKADRESYNASAPGIYDVLDAAFSSKYTFKQFINQGGVTFNYKKDKTLLNFGTKISNINFLQTDQYTGKAYRRNFINWLPQVKYQYQFAQSKSLSLSYGGETVQPTLDQIQPLRVNTDPLNIYLGNPNLRPAFSNAFSGYYTSYSNKTTQRFRMSGSYSFVQNAITSNVVTDVQRGISTISYTNLSDRDLFNYSVSVTVGRIIKSVSTNLTVATNGNINYNYINNALNKATSRSYSALLYLSKSKENKYELYLNGGPVYTIYKMSLQSQNNNNAAGFSLSGSFTFYLPAKLILASDLSYEYKAPTQNFTAQNITLINATISRTFLKDNNLKVSVRGNDLLNQNVYIIRSIYGNINSQTNNAGIRRYFMLTVTWDFTKFKPLKANDK